MGETVRRNLHAIARLAISLSIVMAPICAHAQGAKVSSAIELAQRADALKPGQWVWAPQIAPSGPLLIYIDLSRQLASVYRNGVRIGVTTVSTGKPGYDTPTGVFTILQKDIDHHSNKYDNAAMPFTQRLTWSGVALHAGGLPGYPESHGCIHLPYAFAQALFKVTSLGATVIIAGAAGQPALAAPGDLLTPDAFTPGVHEIPQGADAFWYPDLSPKGPLTIILSRADQQVTVLRNGVVIGRANAEIPKDSDETRVLTLSRIDKGVGVWVYVDVPGHSDLAGQAVPTDAHGRVHVPPAFLQAVRPELTPGATLLITSASLTPDTSGENLTVLEGSQEPAGPAP